MSSEPTPDPAKPEPMRFGGFVVIMDEAGRPKILGEGTFGRTYLAQHQFLQTLAALKVLNERFAAERSARDRFLSEGRALVRLDHRHIARLHDFGEAGGALFYTMEYCAGGNLSERVKSGGALALPDWMLVAQQLASALECCHTAGLVHRDLKPSNIMLARAEGPLVTKLIDFGLVQAELSDGAETRLIGTPLYASPEQLREEPVDARSDLFCLGMTLWHLALGAAPETGNSARIIANRLGADSYAPLLPDSLPPVLRELLAQLVEKDRSQRVASATALLRQLGAAAESLGLPVLHERSAPAPLPLQTTPAATTLEPFEVEERDVLLSEDFEVASALCEQSTGINYLVNRRDDTASRCLLHSLHPQLVRDAALRDRLRENAARLRSLQTPFCLAPASLRSYRDFTVFVGEAPQGDTLLTELKMRGKCPLELAAGLLERIAATADQQIAAGLPGVELAPGRIHLKPPGFAGGGELEPELLPRLLSARDTMELARDIAVADDAGSTMTAELFEDADVADRAPLQFARLVYRIAAGRDCAAAAGLSTRGYVAVPELSETTNRLLGNVIAGENRPASCGSLLADVLLAEGLAGSGATRTANRSTSVPLEEMTMARPSKSAPPPATASAPPPATSTASAAPARTASVPIPLPPAQRTATAAVPLPPVAPLPARTAKPAEKTTPPPRPPSGRKKGPLLDIAIVLGVLALGASIYFLWPKKASPAQGGGTVAQPTPGVKTEPADNEALPADATVRFAGDFPAHTVFAVGGNPVQARSISGYWELPVGGLRLPLTVRATARGYREITANITTREALKAPVAGNIERVKGTVVFTRSGESDYTNVFVKMLEALPSEEGYVPVDRVSRGKELGRGDDRLELPTGRYSIILQGGNGRIVRPRTLQQIEIEDGREQTCALPLTFVGTYRGELRDREGEVNGELVIENGLTGGDYSDTRAGTARRARLEGCRLDGQGGFSALIKFSHSTDAIGFDEIITATQTANGDLTVKIQEAVTDNEGVQRQMARAPLTEKEWSRSGTLTRAR